MEQGLDQNLHIPKDQIVVHGRMGPYLMGKSKWPQLRLPNEIIVQMKESESQECITQSSQALGEQTEVVYDQMRVPASVLSNGSDDPFISEVDHRFVSRIRYYGLCL